MKIFSSLEVKNFRLYWFGTIISMVGNWIQIVAQGWLIYSLTKSEFLLGFIGFLASIPVLVFSLPSGVIADRKSKRYILFITQAVMMVLALIMGLLVSTGAIKVWQIMVIVFLNGTAMALDGPTRQSFILELVGADNLPNAIGLNATAFHGARVIGPAAAGIIIGYLGLAACFYINAVSFLATLIALFAMKNVAGKHSAASGGGILDALKEAFGYLVSNKNIMALIILVAVQSLIVMPYTNFMPVFAKEILHSDAKGLGLLMSSAGLGAVLGALTVAFLARSKRRVMMVMYSYMVFSVFLILFALSKNFVFSQICLVFIGWGTVTSLATMNGIVQMNVPNEMRGRIMSIYMISFAGVMPFGSLIAGIISSFSSVQVTFVLFGTFSMIACAGLYFKKERYLKFRQV